LCRIESDALGIVSSWLSKSDQAMSKSPIPPIRQPRCPKCKERMLLIRLAPNGAGSDVQTFECAKCGETKIVETKDPLTGGWRGVGDLHLPK